MASPKLQGEATDSPEQPKASTSAEASGKQNRLDLQKFASTAIRFGIPNRAAAALGSALLEDMNVLTDDDLSLVIDKNKVHRAKKRCQSAARVEESICGVRIEGLFFDGRKDETIVMQADERGILHPRKVKEEHVSLIQEPGYIYIGHVVPDSGSGNDISKAIVDYLTEEQADLTQMSAIGCDGTAVNTGKHNGVIRCTEVHLGRSLQWLVCLLHFNELPLRHLTESLDGPTQGPTAFSGPVGRNLKNCEQLPVVNFVPIVIDMPEVDAEDLSTDQQFLYEMMQAVSSGMCRETLASRLPGPMVHSRFLTTAVRILRLYVATAQPSENLLTLATYVMRVYGPLWFQIKCYPLCIYGATHLWFAIKSSRYLQQTARAIVEKTIQTNLFFAHPENVLLAMLHDDRKDIRDRALSLILQARQDREDDDGVRKFQVPSLNFEAHNYVDIIHWERCAITEPPLTRGVSEEDLREFVVEYEPGNRPLLQQPCHTQAVERCVKLVTEASKSVYGSTSRDGFIRVRVRERKLMPSFNTKAQYKPPNKN